MGFTGTIRKYLFAGLVLLGARTVPAQEILLSDTEGYYDFLALQGITERPYLNYRTLSDSAWDIDNDGVFGLWTDISIGTRKNLTKEITYRIYGPELFFSYNTTNPYGQNDNVLWQGKGANLFLSAGTRVHLYGFELTLLPQFSFSQNKPFELMPSEYTTGEASKYGYYGIPSIDAPQRFGDTPYYEFSFGDSEIRYTWKNLTIGFGTQNTWLGPAHINPLILSNNAPSYPKLDIGLRRQPVVIRNVYFGDLEIRSFWGRLTESDFFDADTGNDHNLITGFTLAYSLPSFLKGFTIGFNRIMLSKWNDMNFAGFFNLLIPFTKFDAGYDKNDQRASVILDYILPVAGFEVYVEWGINDLPSDMGHFIKNTFTALNFTTGIRKNILINKHLQGEWLLEITNLESARDYEFLWPTTFYAHHIITQGHTNRGQWLGAGLGTGGNSQYLGFTLYHPKGYGNLFIQRESPDKDYIWFLNSQMPSPGRTEDNAKFKAVVSIGLKSYFSLYNFWGFYSKIVYSKIFNPTYNPDRPKGRNLYFSFGTRIQY
jgi:hypothetical protein